MSDLEAWLDRTLAGAGVERLGPVETVRERPWSTIRRTVTTAGTVWIKQVRADYATEIALYPVLAEAVPEHVLVPYEVDAARGLILLPDGGEPLGHRLHGAALAAAMQDAVGRYAAVQQTLSAHVDRLVADGVPDMRPAVLPDRFDEALDATAAHASAEPDTRATWEQVRALRPQYLQWCADLTSSPVPASVDHNDLHPNSVLGDPRTGFRFLDWGDASAAHPFASLLFALDAMPADDRPALRTAYLEQWGDPAELTGTAELAVRVAHVARALVWHRAFGDVPDGDPHAGAPLAQLARMLPAGPT